jgi:hypothetical protein
VRDGRKGCKSSLNNARGPRRNPRSSLAAWRSSEGAQAGLIVQAFGFEEQEMKGKGIKTGDSIDYILASLLKSQSGSDGDKISVRKSIEIYASPEEGVSLIRAFIKIKQPAFRAALIDLATRMADRKD